MMSYPEPVVSSLDHRQLVLATVGNGNKMDEVASFQNAKVVDVVNIQPKIFSCIHVRLIALVHSHNTCSYMHTLSSI